MFKLAELFVEIKADERPVTAALAGLQGKATALATSLGSKLGGAFLGLAGGPIGIAKTALDGLFSLIGKGNEDVAKIGEYWTEATAPIKEALTGAVEKGTAWVKSLIETVKANEKVVAAFNTLKEYGEAAMENIKIAIDQGVIVFDRFKAAAIETFTGVTIILGEVYESIMKAFGNETVASVQTWGQMIQEWILDKAALVGIALRNWPDIIEIVSLQFQQKIANIGEVMATIPANAQIIGTYLQNNWVNLIADAASGVVSIFKNLGTNIMDLWRAVQTFISTGKFEFKPTGLLEGFKATADKLPEMIKAQLSSRAPEIQAILDRIGAREQAGFDEHKSKKKAEEAAAAAAGEPGKFKTELTGVAEFASKIRAGIFNQGGDDTPTKQLSALEKIAKHTEETAKEVKKPKAATLG